MIDYQCVDCGNLSTTRLCDDCIPPTIATIQPELPVEGGMIVGVELYSTHPRLVIRTSKGIIYRHTEEVFSNYKGAAS